MTRRARWTVLVVAAAAAAASPLYAPPLLRKVDWFAAREIEVTGTRLLAPHDVLRATGLRPGLNIWTDPAAWEAALKRHPAVADARVSRRLPHTLRVHVVERRPVALMQDGVLRPATADGTVLPVGPEAALDLPLLRAPRDAMRNGRVAHEGTRRALAELDRLAALDPALLARTSEVRVEADGALRMLLSAPSLEVILPAGADAGRLVRLRAALGDVARRMAADSSIRRPQVDARWEDQIVVRGIG